MTTLPGWALRLVAVVILTVAVSAFCPKAARAQAADSGAAVQSGSSADDTDSQTDGTDDQSQATDTQSAPAGTSSAAKPDSSAKANPSPGAKSDSTSESSSAPSGGYALHTALKSFDSPLRTGDAAFSHASELFPAFCRDWERKLHDRELNNEENVSWKDENGWKTGTYLGYSPIKTCNCKRSTGGVPIGELTYQETEYYLAGRTVEEARHAPPKPVGITNTTEIFRWDKTKWDDGR